MPRRARVPQLGKSDGADEQPAKHGGNWARLDDLAGKPWPSKTTGELIADEGHMTSRRKLATRQLVQEHGPTPGDWACSPSTAAGRRLPHLPKSRDRFCLLYTSPSPRDS